nr:hypothetical protein [Tanacetum cinerariifolium]
MGGRTRRRRRAEHRAWRLEQRVSSGAGRLRLLPQASEQLPDPHLASPAGRAFFLPRVSQHQPVSEARDSGVA